MTLDSFLVSATDYTDLRSYYVTGDWTREQFADKHILFFDRQARYDYVKLLFAEAVQ